MANTYRINRPYSNPNYTAKCVLFYHRIVQDVFFPCEHHCVCRHCIYEEKICEERMLSKIPDGHITCSLCASIIKKIIPLQGGLEVEKYWDWVYEERISLPSEFMRNFRHAAHIITNVYMNDPYKQQYQQQLLLNESKKSSNDDIFDNTNCLVT
jgi:hypothetical protein